MASLIFNCTGRRNSQALVTIFKFTVERYFCEAEHLIASTSRRNIILWLVVQFGNKHVGELLGASTCFRSAGYSEMPRMITACRTHPWWSDIVWLSNGMPFTPRINPVTVFRGSFFINIFPYKNRLSGGHGYTIHDHWENLSEGLRFNELRCPSFLNDDSFLLKQVLVQAFEHPITLAGCHCIILCGWCN